MWKIAIIDDDRQVLQGMKMAIPWEELRAEWAGEAMNGEDGLRLVRETRPDLIITDIYMPVMNGLDMIERLRDLDFQGKIVILSGYSDFEYARQALRLNVTDYLSKPVSLPTLKTVLGQTLALMEEEDAKRMERNELEEKLRLYQPFIEKEWVKSAVSGTLDVSYKQENLLPEPFRFWLGVRHVVVGIEIVRDARVEEMSLSDMNLYRFALSNIALELAADIFPSAEYTELYGTRSALVLHPAPDDADGEELRMRLRQLGAALIDSARSFLKLTIHVGLGSLKGSWRDIPDSTEEAFRAIELKERAAVKGYDLYTLPEGGRRATLARPVKFYQELAGAIKAGQEALAHEIIADYLERQEREGLTAPADLQMLAGELWGVIAYSLYEVGIVLDDLFPGRHVQSEIGGLTRPGALSVWLKEKVTVICNSREWKGSSKHRQAVDFMLQYIHDNFAEDITLAELADKVSISRNYLSNIFKNVTGDTFNNYLTRVRMEKAKELLLEKKMLVYEVAERVGYKNVPYFSTLFKKFTGMNPTELAK
ncbi:response regulator transcription factor [Paenibacillus humicola]|uniref:response regulator transcription factor n=1 Tax=Paenibacillus humicola TaxID=3110540 RepID=UPI00237A2DF2|nr:response regulator transcription factor [Paenibacillus humicola]